MTVAFPNPVDWNRIRTCTQKPDELVHSCCDWLQTIFKENSGLPLAVKSTWVAFNSVY